MDKARTASDAHRRCCPASGVYLYAIQLASTNFQLASRTPTPEPVIDLCKAERGELLAPADPDLDPDAAPPTFPAGSTARDDDIYTFPQIELDGSPRRDEEKPEEPQSDKPWPVTIHLPYTSTRGTHEYDREPPVPNAKSPRSSRSS